MSLEDNIVALIKALETHAVALAKHAEAVVAGAVTKAVKGKKAADEPASNPPPPADAPANVSTPAPVVTTPPAQPAAEAKTAAEAAQLNATTEVVITLANDYSRETALAILGKVRAGRPGVTRCSDLNKLDLVDVFNEATAAVAQFKAAAEAKKATASLI